MIDSTSIDKVIHAPLRLAIMTSLAVTVEADFGHLKQVTGATDGNLTTHLSKLEDAGYVDLRREKASGRPRTVYTMTDPGKKAFAAYLKTLRGITEQMEMIT